MERVYNSIIRDHFSKNKQMIFLSGPRQVGKTTIGMMAKKIFKYFSYLNWDNQNHRRIIIAGPDKVAQHIGLDKVTRKSPLVVFDEIHKYRRWKIFLKGFYDTYKEQVNILVTGSSKLDIYKSQGDSLMGRYFLYRLHPLSVGEILKPSLQRKEISAPTPLQTRYFKLLLRFGGFPEPYNKNNTRFFNKWIRLKQQQLFHEDIRDLTRINELGQIEIFAEVLIHRAGNLLNYSKLANEINVSVDTIRRWLITLNSFHFCFTIRPWSRNIPRSLRKEPKLYLWDWSMVSDPGSKIENFVASHLLKSVHFWTDYGFGNYNLFFLRDKEKREVDFLVTKNNAPWFLVEVKQSQNTSISKPLFHFQKKTNASHAFQVVFDMDYIEQDCFKYKKPIIVPAQTFLSQLI